jgi:beta-lactamase superfamily II metal-dependent hydrolase
MSIVKSFSVGNGDMFYIRHGSDNFTVIDCCYKNQRAWKQQLAEIKKQSADKGITRFISTHPDDDHIKGLCEYVEEIGIINFYCVDNDAAKEEETDDFEEYCLLRDNDKKAFFIYKGCTRKWMNKEDDERKSAGINCLWPDISNDNFKDALKIACEGGSPNNISPILTYSYDGIKFMWMGDLEKEFIEKIKDYIDFPEIAVLFAPHHGRDSGKVPEDVLKKLNPQIIVIGEAPSEHLNYYNDYKTITQNSAGDIVFEPCAGGINVFVGNEEYSEEYLIDNGCEDMLNCHYIGTLVL